MTARVRRALAIAVAAWLHIALIGDGWAGGPRARCRAARVGRRVLVRVTVTDLLDRDLTRLLRSGLEGYLQVSATLVRSRTLWFDDTVASRSASRVLTYRRRRGFAVDGRLIPDPDRVDAGTLSLGVGITSARGLYVSVAIRLRVVTVASLRRTAGWLTGGGGPGVAGERVIRMVVSDLARSASASCGVVDR